MTELLYNGVAKRWKGTGYMPLAFAVLTAILVATSGMLVEDYLTSVKGYAGLPSARVMVGIVYLVAALPQLIQMLAIYIIVGYMTVSKKDRSFFGYDLVAIAFVIWAIAFGLDGYWDYLHKITGYVEMDIPASLVFGYEVYWGAVLDSYGTYGFLSEVLSTVCGGLWIASFREGGFDDLIGLVTEMAEKVGMVVGMLRNIVGSIWNGLTKGLKVEEPKPKPRRKSASSNSSTRSKTSQSSYEEDESPLHHRLRQASKKKTRPKLP